MNGRKQTAHTAGEWELHIGNDYAVVMLPGECTDTASIEIFGDTVDDTSKLGRLIAAIPEATKALKMMLRNCLSDQESRLLMAGVSAQFADPANENSVALQKRCDRIQEAFKLAEAAIHKAEGQ